MAKDRRIDLANDDGFKRILVHSDNNENAAQQALHSLLQ